MYSVRCDGNLVYSPNAVQDGYVIYSSSITWSLNKAGSFEFVVPPTNPMYSEFYILRSIVSVYEDGSEIWRGRVLTSTLDFHRRRTVYCEGVLAFLIDVLIDPFDYYDTPVSMLAWYEAILTQYNASCTDGREVYPGNFFMTNENATMWLVKYHMDDRNTCQTVLLDTLPDHFDGYYRPRFESGKCYLDFYQNEYLSSKQEIRFGRNLLDYEQSADGSELYTYVIPLGATFDSDDEEYDEDNPDARLDITSVTENNENYIYSESGEALYGKIWKVVEYDDIDDPTELLEKAQEDLDELLDYDPTITIDAADLHYLYPSIEKIELGRMVRLYSKPHGVDKYLQCTKIVQSLETPGQNTYTFGAHKTKLTDQQKSSAAISGIVVEDE